MGHIWDRRTHSGKKKASRTRASLGLKAEFRTVGNMSPASKRKKQEPQEALSSRQPGPATWPQHHPWEAEAQGLTHLCRAKEAGAGQRGRTGLSRRCKVAPDPSQG